MQKEILDYLATQRVSVFGIEMLDGSPHAATIHFAYSEDPLLFIFLTNPVYRKSEALRGKEISRASLVIGFEEGKHSKTLQLDGTARLVKSGEEKLKELYFKKFPEKLNKHSEDIFFVFEPTWWRFTDWSRPEGKTIHNSDGTVSVAGKIVK